MHPVTLAPLAQRRVSRDRRSSLAGGVSRSRPAAGRRARVRGSASGSLPKRSCRISTRSPRTAGRCSARPIRARTCSQPVRSSSRCPDTRKCSRDAASPDVATMPAGPFGRPRSLTRSRRSLVSFRRTWPSSPRGPISDASRPRRPDRIAMSTGRNGGPTRELFRRDPVGRALVDEAATVSPEPGAGDFRPDRHTARIATRHLETAQPRFLFVSLGEPDEYAHRGDYRGYLRALRAADLAIGDIARALRERAHQGSRTVLFVTADHGRADDFRNHGREHPESARVWLLAWGTEVSRKPLRRRGRAAPFRSRAHAPQPLRPRRGS